MNRVSIECGECERDLRGPHDLSCSRNPKHKEYVANLKNMLPADFEAWCGAESERQADEADEELC